MLSSWKETDSCHNVEVEHKGKAVSSVEYLQTTSSQINCTNSIQKRACLLQALLLSGYKFRKWPEIKQVPMIYSVPLTQTSKNIPKLLETYSELSEKCNCQRSVACKKCLKGIFYKARLQWKCPISLNFYWS